MFFLNFFFTKHFFKIFFLRPAGQNLVNGRYCNIPSISNASFGHEKSGSPSPNGLFDFKILGDWGPYGPPTSSTCGGPAGDPSGPQKFWAEKNFGSEKIFWSEKNFGSQKFFGSENFFGSKKI